MVERIILTNQTTGQVLTLDKTKTIEYILDSVDWGQIQSTHHSYKFLNQVGVYVEGTTLETRDISVTGWIVERNEEQMTVQKRWINAFVNPMQKMLLSYSKYVIEFLPYTSVKYSVIYPENNELICKFKIDGLAFDPLFKGENKTLVSAAEYNGHFHFPMSLGVEDDGTGYETVIFGVRNNVLIINVYNGGAVSTGMEIMFKARGAVTNPSIIKISTQEIIKINKTLEAGEEILINTTIGEKGIVGRLNGVESNYYKYRDLSSSWMQLDVGDNLLRYDADTNLNNLECYVYFYDKYLEVQECN